MSSTDKPPFPGVPCPTRCESWYVDEWRQLWKCQGEWGHIGFDGTSVHWATIDATTIPEGGPAQTFLMRRPPGKAYGLIEWSNAQQLTPEAQAWAILVDFNHRVIAGFLGEPDAG